MDDLHLVILDTTGIQSYIFGSNRLRENVGASHLVHMATSGWLLESPNRFLPNNRHNIKNGERQDTPNIRPDKTVDAELLYAGGGNTVLLFQHADDVREFGRTLSTELITKAPGLNVVMVVELFNWQDSLVCAMEKAMRNLAEKKRRREFDQPLLGLSVTAACQSTGFPANYNGYETDPDTKEQSWSTISAEVYGKQQQNRAAKARLQSELIDFPNMDGDDKALLNQFDFPDDFDDLGRSKGEESYIGVVHADGNGIGKRLAEIADACREYKGDDNRHYIERLRQFSDDANHAGLAALREVVTVVARWQSNQEQETQSSSAKQSKLFLKLRPIVYGGDDVTYVCDGRIALQTAQLFLDAFGRQTILGQNGIAGAGIAIVKTHYPFARAYHLAEALTKSAKTAYQRKEAAMDWHLAQSGLFGTLKQIREEEYLGPDQLPEDERYSLLMRPLSLATTTENWRTWGNFIKLLMEFQTSPEESKEEHLNDEKPWARNKLMELRSALRQAMEAENTAVVELFTQRNGILPEITNVGEKSRRTGWQGNHCVYYDAIEMLSQELFDQESMSQTSADLPAQRGGVLS